MSKCDFNKVALQGLACLDVFTNKINLSAKFLSLPHYITLIKARVNERSTFTEFNWNVQHYNDFI